MDNFYDTFMTESFSPYAFNKIYFVFYRIKSYMFGAKHAGE